MTRKEAIIRQVSDRFGSTPTELIGHNRSRHLVRARFVAIWFFRNVEGLSSTHIGRFFSGRDHSSILHAARRAEQLFESDLDLRAARDELIDRFSSTNRRKLKGA